MSGSTSDTMIMTGPNFQQRTPAQILVTPTGNPQRALVDALSTETTATGLTAAGTTQANGLQLTAQVNNLTTVAASTGVVLPPVSQFGVGVTITVFHNGVSNLKIYGAGSDTIDGTAGATGVTLTAAHRCQFFAIAAATWLSAQMGVTSA